MTPQWHIRAQACLHFVDSFYQWMIQGLTIVTEQSLGDPETFAPVLALCLEKVNYGLPYPFTLKHTARGRQSPQQHQIVHDMDLLYRLCMILHGSQKL